MSASDRFPRAVACMPTWNSEPFIRETLESLVAQTYANLEILICDDASTDGTAAICEQFSATHSRIRFTRQAVRRGWIGNVNSLLEKAQGDYFFFAFHDDPLKPTYVARLVETLEHNPRAVLAFSDVELNGETRCYCELEGIAERLERAKRMLRRTGYWWIPNRGLFRANAARQVGGLRRHLAGEFSADWPWLLRLALLGEFVRVPEPLTRKVLRKESLSNTWSGSTWQRIGASLACMREVRCARIPISEELLMHWELPLYWAKRKWWQLNLPRPD
jgi:glycosyltransferase involved in cell wall biosynthesis